MIWFPYTWLFPCWACDYSGSMNRGIVWTVMNGTKFKVHMGEKLSVIIQVNWYSVYPKTYHVSISSEVYLIRGIGFPLKNKGLS